MNILNKISKSFKVVASDVKSDNAEIDKLLNFSKINVPTEYIKIIKERTEIEISVDNEKYIRI